MKRSVGSAVTVRSARGGTVGRRSLSSRPTRSSGSPLSHKRGGWTHPRTGQPRVLATRKIPCAAGEPDRRIVVTDVPRHRTFQIFNSDGSFDRGVRVGNDLLAVAGPIHAGRGSGSAVFMASGELVRYLPMRPDEQEDPPGTPLGPPARFGE